MMYRMDRKSEEPWSLICDPIRGAGQHPVTSVVPAAVQRQESLRIEYLKAVFQTGVGTWFSSQTMRACMDDPRGSIEREATNYFQILKLASDKSRPHVMPTVTSRQETMLRERLALCTPETPKKVDCDGLVVYVDCDPVWVSWKDLGDFHSAQRTLTRYSVTGAESDAHPGCLVLTNPERAVPPYPLTDSRTPCLTILGELFTRGWKPIEGKVVHTDATISVMDGREAIRMKTYYLLLLDIERCMPLTSAIPSDEPILFYRLLMDGVRCEPGLGNAAYLAIKAGDPLPAAPLEDEHQSEDSDEICVFGQSPPPKARGRGVAPPVPSELIGIIDDPTDLDPRGPLRAAGAKRKAAAPKPKVGPKADVLVPSHVPAPKAKSTSKMPPPVGPPLPLPPPAVIAGPAPPPGEDDIEIFAEPPPPLPLASPFTPVVKAKGKGRGGRGRRAREEERAFVPALGGSGEVFFEEFLNPSTGKMYPNWIFKCPHTAAHGATCQRTMGVVGRNTHAGELEPLAFLHVWRDTPPAEGKNHRTSPVPRAEVLRYLETHRRELQLLADSFKLP